MDKILAIEILREFVENTDNAKVKDAILELHPALAESKDEKIRKKMVEHFKNKTKKTWCNIPVEDIISYLEKQKEQKDYRKLYEEVVKSDWFIEKYAGKSLGEEQNSLDASGTAEPDYGICDDFIPAALHFAMARHGWYACHVGEEERGVLQRKKYVERNWPADKDNLTQGQKPTNLLDEIKHYLAITPKEQLRKDREEIERWYKEHMVQTQDEPSVEQKQAGWSEEDLQHKSWILECLADGKRTMPQYAADFHAAYNWLKSLGPQLKQEWSKEDENIRHDIIARLESLLKYETQYIAKACLQKEISWLKSLSLPKPSYNWKPTKEQLEALNALNDHGGLTYIGQLKKLISLYHDLKKL